MDLANRNAANERELQVNDDSTPPLSPDEILVLAKAARLTLRSSRAELLTPALNDVMANFDMLDEVDLAETPPTNAFDPRWRT
ncbi:MAG: hypothetical protein AAFN79_02325 [Pseudomonadota bacterium]